MLKAHANAPRHVTTASQLAKAVGYKNYRATNLQYGKFAHRVVRRLRVPAPPKGFWLYVLVDWDTNKKQQNPSVIA